MAHRTAREGVIAGLIGATAVAVWFLIIDIVHGHPFYTPAVLGRGLFSVLGGSDAGDSEFLRIAVYTVFHYVAFIAVGLLAAMVVHAAQREPEILAAAIVIFIIFELGITGIAALMSEQQLIGNLGWLQIAMGTLVATIAMGFYLWKTHPDLRQEFTQAFGHD